MMLLNGKNEQLMKTNDDKKAKKKLAIGRSRKEQTHEQKNKKTRKIKKKRK